MSDEKNTVDGEQATDIKDDEQVSNSEVKSEGGELTDQQKADKEAVKQAEKDKVPEWVKAEWLKEQSDDFDNRYSTKRDKELYDQNLPKIVKENNLTAEEQTAITEEVDKLRKYKDDKGQSMSYEQALRLATKELNSTTLKQAVKIAAGALPPEGQVGQTFNPVSVSKFDDMTPASQKKYMDKSKELYGAVKFN